MKKTVRVFLVATLSIVASLVMVLGFVSTPVFAQTGKIYTFLDIPSDGKPYDFAPDDPYTKARCRYLTFSHADHGADEGIRLSAHINYLKKKVDCLIRVSIISSPDEAKTKQSESRFTIDPSIDISDELTDALRILHNWKAKGVPSDSKSILFSDVKNFTLKIEKHAGEGDSFPATISITDGQITTDYTFYDLTRFESFVDYFIKFKGWLIDADLASGK